MKAVKLTAAICLVCSAFTAGIYASAVKTDSQIALEECAREHNVFQCEWKAVPSQEPKVIYKQADLLPPPAEDVL